MLRSLFQRDAGFVGNHKRFADSVAQTKLQHSAAWDGVDRRTGNGHSGAAPHPSTWDGVERRKGIATTAPKVPSQSAALPSGVAYTPVSDEADVVRTLGGVPWAGVLTGVLAAAAANECVLLHLSCAQVAMVTTEKFARELHFHNVFDQINKVWQYQVRHVCIAPLALVQDLHRSCQERTERNAEFALSFDDRFKRLYSDIIETAVRMGVSDIHLRTRDEVGTVLVRLDGTVRPWLQLPKQLLLDTLTAGFGHFVVPGTATDTQFKSKEPLAFMARYSVVVECNGKKLTKEIEGRYNHRPHLTGLSAVIRLLESSANVAEIPTLVQLGYSHAQLKKLELGMSRQWGLVIFVGSTGQGKSTSLRTLQTHNIAHPETSIVYTLESPAEYRYPHAIQFSQPMDVNDTPESIQRKMLAVVKDFLRMDGDRGMVGEIRDKESARMVIEFTQSGHPTATTIHGNSAIDGLSRMTGDTIAVPAQDLGGENVLNTVVYQRLLPKLCPHCKVSATHPDHGLSVGTRNTLWQKFGLAPNTMFVANPTGCDACRPRGIGMAGNGTKGMTVAAEVLIPNGAMRDFITARNWRGLSIYWRSQRKSRFDSEDTDGKTAFEHALYLASQGIVSPLDIEANFEPFDLYEIHPVDVDKSWQGVDA